MIVSGTRCDADGTKDFQARELVVLFISPSATPTSDHLNGILACVPSSRGNTEFEIIVCSRQNIGYCKRGARIGYVRTRASTEARVPFSWSMLVLPKAK